jgi:hypothetical protein
MPRLGHKRIENTMIYMQFVNFKSDVYYSTTTTVEGARKLAEDGWQKWGVINGVHVYREPK